MAKFYVGQKVLVTGNSYYDFGRRETTDMFGKICSIKSVVDDGVLSVWAPEKSDYWYFNESDLQPITETPETLTINGVEYIRKPAPEHEWKFGDVAIHGLYGVGIVFGVESEDTIVFKEKETLSMRCVSPRHLTFLRRTDFSV